MAVLPSADSATQYPWRPAPIASLATSLWPCWVHTPLLRTKTHAAPVYELSANPPTTAVLPSADSAMELPCWAAPTASVPTSFDPCWMSCARAVCDEKSSVAQIRTDAPNPQIIPTTLYVNSNALIELIFDRQCACGRFEVTYSRGQNIT